MALQSMAALASITLQEASLSVSFSGIPQNYRDLILVLDSVQGSAGNSYITFNGDNGSNYSVVTAVGSGSATASFSGTAISVQNNYGLTNATAQRTITSIFDYARTDKHKPLLWRWDNASSIGVIMGSGRWSNTNTITSIQVTAGFAIFAPGTTLNLYGRIA